MARRAAPQAYTERLLLEALRFRLEGRTDEALDRLNAVLVADEGHGAANLAMADILKTAGDRNAALAAVRRAAEAAPDDTPLWARFVFELRDAGRKAQARQAARRPGLPAAARKQLIEIAEGRLALVDDIAELILAGRVDVALARGIDRLERFPQDGRLLNLLGVAALADEDPVRAEAVLRRALAIAPASVPVIANLGLALVRQGRGYEAVQVLEPAAKAETASLNLRVNLGAAFLRAARLDDALRLAEALSQEAPTDQEVLGIRAEALIGLGRATEALDLMRAASDRSGFTLQDVLASAISEVEGREAATAYADGLPGLTRDAAGRLAALLAEWGELDRAALRARVLAEGDPRNPAPFRLLGLCARWQDGDPLIAQMRQSAASEDLAPTRRGAFGLALAKAYMDTGDDSRAFEALTEGNHAIRSAVGYDVAEDEASMARIADVWTPAVIDAARAGNGGPAPVFIVGLPRSGSTLIETILSRHREVEAMGETPLIHGAASLSRFDPGPDAIAGVRHAVAEALTPAPPKLVKTDKLLANFLNIGVLAAAFPRARFIETRRDYRDTCLSIYQADLGALAHPYAMDLEELARYAVAYDRLMAHWAAVVGDKLIRVRYEDVVTDPGTQVSRLVAALDLEWDPACLSTGTSFRRINTMSVAQARKPISGASVGRWRRFETGLAPLTRILEANGLVQTP